MESRSMYEVMHLATKIGFELSDKNEARVRAMLDGDNEPSNRAERRARAAILRRAAKRKAVTA